LSLQESLFLEMVQDLLNLCINQPINQFHPNLSIEFRQEPIVIFFIFLIRFIYNYYRVVFFPLNMIFLISKKIPGGRFFEMGDFFMEYFFQNITV